MDIIGMLGEQDHDSIAFIPILRFNRDSNCGVLGPFIVGRLNLKQFKGPCDNKRSDEDSCLGSSLSFLVLDAHVDGNFILFSRLLRKLRILETFEDVRVFSWLINSLNSIAFKWLTASLHSIHLHFAFFTINRHLTLREPYHNLVLISWTLYDHFYLNTITNLCCISFSIMHINGIQLLHCYINFCVPINFC